MEKFFSPKTLVLGVVAAGALLAAAQTFAQANEQFVPALVYRSGSYAPNGVPFANGYSDYLTLVNERDGGFPRDKDGKPTRGLSLEKLDGYWNEAKERGL